MENITKATMDFQYTRDRSSIIKVIGVGGGGGNAVEHMYTVGMHDVSFVLCNTDYQALNKSNIPTKVQFGEGLGAGGIPEKGKKAAEESIDQINHLLNDGTKMVFITAGMGGGTGTGAAPVIAQIAKEKNILTVGIVSIPFLFEGTPKILQAFKGVEEMSKHVDALLVINNERLRNIYSDLDIPNAFQKADETLTTAARSIAEIITIAGIINLDFRDVETTLKNGGVAIMSTGIASGSQRLTQSIENALNSPLLNNNNPFSAKKVLFNVYFSKDNPLKMSEMDQVNDFMRRFNQQKIEVIWGLAYDESLGDSVKMTLLASGFEMSNIPGVVQINEEEQRKQEEEDQLTLQKAEELIRSVYGTTALANGGKVRLKPIVLKGDQLDDDLLIEELEKNPSYNREISFVQRFTNQHKNNKAAPSDTTENTLF